MWHSSYIFFFIAQNLQALFYDASFGLNVIFLNETYLDAFSLEFFFGKLLNYPKNRKNIIDELNKTT